jgi:hypothetical protein
MYSKPEAQQHGGFFVSYFWLTRLCKPSQCKKNAREARGVAAMSAGSSSGKICTVNVEQKRIVLYWNHTKHRYINRGPFLSEKRMRPGAYLVIRLQKSGGGCDRCQGDCEFISCGCFAPMDDSEEPPRWVTSGRHGYCFGSWYKEQVWLVSFSYLGIHAGKFDKAEVEIQMEQNPGQPYGVPTFTGYKNSQPYCHVSPIEFEDWLGDVPNIEKKELEDWDRWIKLEEGEE